MLLVPVSEIPYPGSELRYRCPCVPREFHPSRQRASCLRISARQAE